MKVEHTFTHQLIANKVLHYQIHIYIYIYISMYLYTLTGIILLIFAEKAEVNFYFPYFLNLKMSIIFAELLIFVPF